MEPEPDRISNYGIIGNLRTAALVGDHGGIDWLCLPDFDSPSAFAALLDGHAGRFSIRPVGGGKGNAAYLAQTNILVTTFQNQRGALQVTDFMAVAADDKGRADAFHLYRRARVIRGEMDVELRFAPRFDYARAPLSLHGDGSRLTAEGGGQRLILESSLQGLEIKDDEARADWRLAQTEDLWLRLSWGQEQPGTFRATEAQQTLEETATFWRNWLAQKEPVGAADDGLHRHRIDRSALLLKLLQYHPTGALIAAPTTSLPETLGGGRNWDYRFSWVRDSALTLNALFSLGHVVESDRYLHWLKEVLCSCLECECAQCESASHLRVLYGLRGEKKFSEEELHHLSGFKGSRPVRIGNGAIVAVNFYARSIPPM